MFHVTPTRWSAFAVAGLISGLVTAPLVMGSAAFAATEPAATGPAPALPAATEPMAPAPSGEPSGAPSPTEPGAPVNPTDPMAPTAGPTQTTGVTPEPTVTTPVPSPSAAAKLAPQPPSRGDRARPGGEPVVPGSGSLAVVDNRTQEMGASWTSYLPTPETGLKLFAAGVVGLFAAIGGLAAMAIRRRTY
jgi:hypothetical protein